MGMAVTRAIVVDHVLLVASNMDASRRFYTAALGPLGFGIVSQEEDGVTYGVTGSDDFAVFQGKLGETTTAAAHVAFVAESSEAVDAFFAAAMAAGGQEHSSPRIRREYHAGYYAAYVYDPDGNNIEAVYHGPH
jgi:catechol 2,3-dioxygenase-like lactoylglutathione lyase family enzyme